MLAVHLKHGMTRTIISPNQVEKGMILYFRYKKLDGSASTYVGTVLNADYEKKMHVLSMEHINLQDFRDFASQMGIQYIARFQNFRGVDIPKIVMAAPSKAIYTGKIKKQLASKLNNSYRTLILKNLSGLQLLDYDFGPELQKTLG